MGKRLYAMESRKEADMSEKVEFNSQSEFRRLYLAHQDLKKKFISCKQENTALKEKLGRGVIRADIINILTSIEKEIWQYWTDIWNHRNTLADADPCYFKNKIADAILALLAEGGK